MDDLFSNPEITRRLAYSAVIVVVLWLIRRGVLHLVEQRIRDVKLGYRWRKTSNYVTSALAVLLLAQVWVVQFRSLSTYLGLLTAGLAIALQSLILNVAGWVFILWRRPFDVGDRIQVGDLSGDVIDLRAFAFSMLEIGNWVDAEQSTGRIIHVPNSIVFQQAVANSTRDFAFIWDELPVMITFESNWEKARELLTEIVNSETFVDAKSAEELIRRTNRHFMIYYARLTPTVYLKVAESGVMLTMRFICEPRKRRDAEQTLWERVLRAFAQHDDIDLAYPTRRVYSNLTEGQPGARTQSPHLEETR